MAYVVKTLTVVTLFYLLGVEKDKILAIIVVTVPFNQLSYERVDWS